ncbi:apolipoprotein N-acyltransferase [Rickettsiella grylli]|uniref:apolipoprotein N-acyltransferase n=1 Tax=Rickettsiella grylli TaxID=59196 RepID=UPI000AD0AE04|nr:apolipoprotein N-acyltransferase [Rickettsiella grylli]
MTIFYKEMSALIAGGLLAFAFAPVGIYPFAILSPAVLFLLWLKSSAGQAFILGLLFGIGFYGIGVSWVFISIHEFGHTSLFLASLITGLFIVILALFTALQGFLVVHFFPKNTFIKLYIIFPSTWALMEWVRSLLFTGFPWLLLGTSQVNTPLSGYAPIVGIYGVTFIVTLTASLLLTVFYPLFNKPFNCQLDLKHFYSIYPVLALISLWILGWGFHFIPWTHTEGKPIQISLVQANIPQEIKWNPQYQKTALRHYQQLTQSHWNSRLIVWPEAAIPLLSHQAEPFLNQLDRQAKYHKTTLITGIPIQKGFHYFNGMLALGLDKATYYKQRLVIFGEYLPWWIVWAHGLLNLLNIPLSSFSPGPTNQPLFNVAHTHLGTFICYEIAYSNLVRHALKKKAQLLLTINDDAWFGHSFALGQHLQIGQFQALATGRYLAFLSNTGLTAIVTSKGKIIAKLPPFKSGVLTHTLYKSIGQTPWVFLGDHSIIIFLAVLCILCYACQKTKT